MWDVACFRRMWKRTFTECINNTVAAAHVSNCFVNLNNYKSLIVANGKYTCILIERNFFTIDWKQVFTELNIFYTQYNL